jgi:hypothetical protein
MKTCLKCKLEKTLDNYQKRAKNGDGLDNKCKECSSAYHKNIYQNSEKRRQNIREGEKRSIQRNKKLVEEYKLKNPCMDCSISDIEVLSFDHVVGKKRFNIADGVQRGVGEETLLLEIEKCEVVCMNCHTKRTKRRKRESV